VELVRGLGLLDATLLIVGGPEGRPLRRARACRSPTPGTPVLVSSLTAAGVTAYIFWRRPG